MSQHDYDVANGTGAVVRADINLLSAAIASQNSGTAAPSVTFAYMLWADTTSGLMKIRNAANSAWISLFTLSTGLVIGTNVQAYDAQLAALAALSPSNGDFTRWTNSTTAVTQPIVGTVSQSGGTPTGGIVEAGSNSNGNYVRFADGTQICWTHNRSASGSAFTLSYTWTFPAAFVDTNISGWVCNEASSSTGQPSDNSGRPAGTSLNVQSATSALLSLMANNTFAAAMTATLRGGAIGRWY